MFLFLLCQNDTKLLEQFKTGFKKKTTIKWIKYRSQMTIQSQNNLNYLIDPILTNVNRLFVLSFQRIAGEVKTTKDRFFFTLLCAKCQNKRLQRFN